LLLWSEHAELLGSRGDTVVTQGGAEPNDAVAVRGDEVSGIEPGLHAVCERVCVAEGVRELGVLSGTSLGTSAEGRAMCAHLSLCVREPVVQGFVIWRVQCEECE
jgi:hypothetical protein